MTAFLPPSRLLSGGRPGGHPAALAPGPRSWSDFAAACEGVARAWGRRGAEGPVVLACQDAWDFAAGLMGLLAAGRDVAIPPSFLAGALEAVPGASGILDVLPPPAEPGPARTCGGQVTFWTSGSTGAPKAVVRNLAQLDAEVEVLEGLFGALAGAAPVAGTVPHHHIYGCLFRLLWPLAAGRPFRAQACGDPAAFLEAVPGAVLVSSPASLSRLWRLLDPRAMERPPAAIFSSGGPLAQADALAWLPPGVVEVYGSTETGGIAWRRQDGGPGSDLWRPFPDVAVTFGEDGALGVEAFRAGPAPVRMEDAAQPAEEGRFRLMGRLDRIVKLHEKRIALPAVEAALESHPFVHRAAAVLLEGARPALGAVLVLAEGAPESVADLAHALRSHLEGRLEGAAIPRRWRVAAELPYDERGKLLPGALSALFQPGETR
ncbi:MAG TPA: AMP-binding protein [Holophaga sp.]|nr:AMP-binding protein [Holophaga sp.]